MMIHLAILDARPAGLINADIVDLMSFPTVRSILNAEIFITVKYYVNQITLSSCLTIDLIEIKITAIKHIF